MEQINDVCFQKEFFNVKPDSTDHLFCIRQILEKKWEYNEAVHQLCIDYKKAYDSVRREVLYNILIEFWDPQETGKVNKNVSD